LKNFLILSAVFPPEPVVSASISSALAETLSQEGEDVEVLCPQPTRPQNFRYEENEIIETGYMITRVNSFTYPASGFIGRMRESYSFGKYCAAHIAVNHTKIKGVYANTWPLLAQYLTVRVARKHQIPVVLHIQDMYPEAILGKLPFFRGAVRALLLPLDQYILKRATHVVAISERMKMHLVKTRKIDAAKVSVVCNWQDESDFIQDVKIGKETESAFTFMYLGNIGPVAGLETVIEAFVQAGFNDSRLVIAGSGSMKNQLQEKANQHPKTLIEFWPVPAGKVSATQGKSDVMILPIKKGAALSSIPSKLPAYMFSSKPVLASVDHDSDTAQAVTESGCGWVVEPESVDELATMMRKVRETNQEELDLRGERGYEYAMEHFSKQRNLPRLVKIIEETIK